jgi:hypothetical protein
MSPFTTWLAELWFNHARLAVRAQAFARILIHGRIWCSSAHRTADTDTARTRYVVLYRGIYGHNILQVHEESDRCAVTTVVPLAEAPGATRKLGKRKLGKRKLRKNPSSFDWRYTEWTLDMRNQYVVLPPFSTAFIFRCKSTKF